MPDSYAASPLAAARPSTPARPVYLVAPTPTVVTRVRHAVVVALAVGAIVAVASVMKAPELVLPMGPDQGVYAYVGQVILTGGVPYRDVWENKPPGTYLLYAGAIGLLDRPWSACEIRALPYYCGALFLHSLDLAYSLVLASAIYGAARLWGLRGSNALLAPLLCVLFVNQALMSHGGLTPEKLALLPATLSFSCFLAFLAGRGNRWLAASGLCGGLAFLFKQPGILVLGAVALSRFLGLEVWRRRTAATTWAKELAVLSGAASVPLLATGLYLIAAGALADFVDQAVVFNLRYASSDSDRLAWNFAASLWRNFNQATALLWLYAAAGTLGLLLAPRLAPKASALLLWAAFDVLSLFMGGSKFGDRYFVQLVPSFSLLAAVGLRFLWVQAGATTGWSQVSRNPAKLWLPVASVAVLTLSVPFQAGVALRAWHDRLANGVAQSPEELAAAWAHTEMGRGNLYVWGYASQVYAISGAWPPSQFIHHVPLSQHFAVDPAFRERRMKLLEDLTARPPKLIGIDPSTHKLDPNGSRFLRLSSFPELETFLRERYSEENASGIPGWRLFTLRPVGGRSG